MTLLQFKNPTGADWSNWSKSGVSSCSTVTPPYGSKGGVLEHWSKRFAATLTDWSNHAS